MRQQTFYYCTAGRFHTIRRDIWKLHLYIIIICVKVFEITLFSKTNNHNIALGFRDIIPNVDIKITRKWGCLISFSLWLFKRFCRLIRKLAICSCIIFKYFKFEQHYLYIVVVIWTLYLSLTVNTKWRKLLTPNALDSYNNKVINVYLSVGEQYLFMFSKIQNVFLKPIILVFE